jgi:hypothetical protein
VGKLRYQVIGGAYFAPPGSSLGYPTLDYWVGIEGFYQLYGGELARWPLEVDLVSQFSVNSRF